MKKLNIAFFGAPDFATDVLHQIIDDSELPVELRFVVTQPDRKAGRDQILTPTPVKLLAQKYNIPIYDNLQLEIVNSKLQEIDFVLLYAFGKLIPAKMLKIPKWGFWNIHPSLLPKYRGPSPIVYPLLLGEIQTGVSLIQMDERMDHGQILMQEEYSIQNEDTQEILKKRLSGIGYKLFKESIQQLINGALQKKEQDHSKATFTRLLTKKDGFISFATVQKIIKGEPLTSDEIPPIVVEYYTKNKLAFPESVDCSLLTVCLFKALAPWPGLWTLLPNGKRLIITRISLNSLFPHPYPLITHVQLEGKKEVDFATFNAAYKAF